MGQILTNFYKSNFARWVSSDLDKLFPNAGWTPPTENMYGGWWEARFDPMWQKVLTPQEQATTWPIRDQLSDALRKWDKGDHSEQLSGYIVGLYRKLLEKLPSREQLLKRTSDAYNDPVVDRFWDGARSVVEATLTRIESVERSEEYDLTMAKYEVARKADADGRPTKELWVSDGETPAAYWESNQEFVPPELRKISQDLIESLKVLEDPAFDMRPLSERVETFKELNRNYEKLRDGMRRERGYRTEKMPSLLAEAMRPLVAGEGWTAAQPRIDTGRYSGPIIALTRMPDVPNLPPAERKDFEARREIVNRDRERRRELLKRERERPH